MILLFLDQLCQRLSPFDVTLIALGTSFVSHLYFRHLEPRSNVSLLILLIFVPTLLSIPISYHVRYPFASVPLAFASYGTFLVFFTVSYRLSPLHPLAKYPGPVIAKTSKWWGAYIGTRGDLHLYYKSLHDRYGDVVRVGPNELCIRDASIIHPVLGQGGLPKGPRWEGTPGRPSVIDQRDPIKHLEQRKPWNRAFSSTAVKEYEGILATRVRQLVSCLEDRVNGSDQKAGVELDMSAWFSYFATDFMGDVMFGGGFELMKSGGSDDGVRSIIELASRLGGIFAHINYILPPLISITGKSGSIQRIQEFSKERVSQRLQNGANRKDLFYHLSGEEMPESERLTAEDLRLEGLVAIIAGSDTVNGTLTSPPNEVDAAFPSGEEPLDVTKLSQMEWLNGCINETLRLQPPVPSGSGRSLDKGKGAKMFGKWFIPEETQLALHTYSIHRDPRNFHTPDAFLPERWFSNGAPKGEHNAAAFFPFGYGRTICAGKNLASMEMRMVLCWILRHLRFSKAPGVTYEGWDERIQDWNVIHNEPLVVRISLRE
ncbi:high nitrogen upregulated cytochrome P450 monooxygenase 2 [Lactarius quietus]|nr:high nitrogen upregulated cytochrome P450 monooxygenase 2 [Lactarius quietus]